MPADATGNEAALRHFLRVHFDIAKVRCLLGRRPSTGSWALLSGFGGGDAVVQWFALAVLCLELLSALCACLLKAVRPDDDEDLDDAPLLRQPLLHTAQQCDDDSEAGGGAGSGSAVKYEQRRERMRDKYGLDTTRFTQPPPSPLASHAELAEGPPPPLASRSTCVVA